MDTAYLVIQDLKKSFGGQEVLRGVNFSIDKGESIAVIGQSGCGKSVLLKHLLRLMDPDSGSIVFENQELSWLRGKELTEIRKRFGMLFQSAALFDSLTVRENVGLGLTEQRIYLREEIDERVMEKLSLVRLADSADKYPSELSGGMRKRVGLARAIANDPEFLLYDEPTTGLDPITSDVINDLIVELNEKLNVTSITVTHDMRSAFKIAERIIMLHEGKVIFDGTPERIRTTDQEIVRKFIRGESS